MLLLASRSAFTISLTSESKSTLRFQESNLSALAGLPMSCLWDIKICRLKKERLYCSLDFGRAEVLGVNSNQDPIGLRVHSDFIDALSRPPILNNDDQKKTCRSVRG